MLATVIDIETTGWYSIDKQTGTLPDKSEILEVGYIRCDSETGKIVSYGDLYFYKPYFYIESNVQEIHGLTRAFLEQFEDKFDMNLITLNSLIQQTCIIGKNSSAFDIPFITEFIYKHSNGALNLDRAVNNSKIKLPNGELLTYSSSLYALDIQEYFAREFQRLYAEKYDKNISRKGKLGEYIDVLNSHTEVKKIYDSFESKTRVTGEHGALYDAVMTYVVWCYCKDNRLY